MRMIIDDDDDGDDGDDYDDDDDDDDDDKEVGMHNSCKCTNHLLPFQFELTLQ